MRRLLFLCLLTAACGSAGLTDVEVDWTFGGKTCDQAGVASIDIEIVGQNLFPHLFTCAQAGTGVDLGTFSRGTYEVTILGTDANGTATYSGDFIIQVLGGGSSVNTLDSVGLFGNLDLRWTFDGGSCAGAGVSSVTISVDGVPLPTSDGTSKLPCSSGGSDGLLVAVLAGTHQIGLDAVDSSGNRYSATFNASITDSLTTEVDVDLALVH